MSCFKLLSLWKFVLAAIERNTVTFPFSALSYHTFQCLKLKRWPMLGIPWGLMFTFCPRCVEHDISQCISHRISFIPLCSPVRCREIIQRRKPTFKEVNDFLKTSQTWGCKPGFLLPNHMCFLPQPTAASVSQIICFLNTITAVQWAEPPCEAVSFLLLKNRQAEAVENLLGMQRKESLPSVGGCWQVPPNAFLNSGSPVGCEISFWYCNSDERKLTGNCTGREKGSQRWRDLS